MNTDTWSREGLPEPEAQESYSYPDTNEHNVRYVEGVRGTLTLEQADITWLRIESLQRAIDAAKMLGDGNAKRIVRSAVMFEHYLRTGKEMSNAECIDVNPDVSEEEKTKLKQFRGYK